ncbi:hypothetical protein [Ktedonosporobacter rubrisoli]|uniref:hypothetical protein n=1 Tax=Ktedonosporobacter rubrisoli TaxID=2509675 RepID=UPI0013EE63DA|nr:hypothetical protein [Ktedonosporobacter rubrisoli]
MWETDWVGRELQARCVLAGWKRLSLLLQPLQAAKNLRMELAMYMYAVRKFR